MLKPWYKVVTPREDLREGKPLDASEFAVHLDKVRDERAPRDYQDPERFFERTYLTKNLTDLAAEVIRRLSGETTGASAVFNMATQFGGGKTHALTLLYHLARGGPEAGTWVGVDGLLQAAGVKTIPRAATAVFVGTEFDSLTGRGGHDGTPLRKTPWGEIAFQLGGEQGLAVVAEHERQMTAPAGDVIRRFIPKDRPCLILIDELMNYVSRNRKSGLSGQLYDFMQNLSEVARSQKGIVLAVSVPASELEMTAEDQSDYERFKKMLDRVGKAILISAETETSEIIRRRLFEWDPRAVSADGRILLPREASETCAAFAAWVLKHRQQLPTWFPIDNAREAFEATYPFHPMLLSVFERKWQTLPRFQQTRGVLRLMALWVSHAYRQGYQGAHRDPLIGLGTAPLEDPTFRAALLEQLGENRLEGAITTDIIGKPEAHAVRLDNEAEESIQHARLHRKVATCIFFESNGGMVGAQAAHATVPELRLDVGEPGLDVGNIETVLEALGSSCYYLSQERNHYRFSILPNLNKLLADRRANVHPQKIDEAVREAVQKAFSGNRGIDVRFFPENSGQIPDRPVLTLVVLPPEQSREAQDTRQVVETMIRQCGMKSRTYKSALIWAVADSDAALKERARAMLAWKEIQAEQDALRLDDAQREQLAENLGKARRDLDQTVWRAYKNVLLLDKENTVHVVDLGLVHSSAASSLVDLILNRLQQDGELTEVVAPRLLVRNWPPAFPEWSTEAVRAAFFSSPRFPRLKDAEVLKDTIARGVSGGVLAYVGKRPDGGYEPFFFETALSVQDIEFSDDTFIITAEEARKHIEPPKLTTLVVTPQEARLKPGEEQCFAVEGQDQHGRPIALDGVTWTATGGTIDDSGTFRAGEEEGRFAVTAAVGTVAGAARILIEPKKIGDGGSGTIGGGDRVCEPHPRPVVPTRLSWSGEVPHQKWVSFYTKVLSRFARGSGLKLTVKVEVTSPDGISEEQMEEMKVALRELGIADVVDTE